MDWKQGQEEIILDYVMAGQKSSLDAPPITQPCPRHAHGGQDGWCGGGWGHAGLGRMVGAGVGAQLEASQPH